MGHDTVAEDGKCLVDIRSDTPPAVGVPDVLAVVPELTPAEAKVPAEVPPKVGNCTLVNTWATLVAIDSRLVMPTMSVRVGDEKVKESTQEKEALESLYPLSMVKSIQIPSNK
jgi:hypothetical protein